MTTSRKKMGGGGVDGGPSLGIVVVGAVAVRLAVFLLPGLEFVPRILERRPELSTPINSFMSVKEALHLQSLHVSALSQGKTAPKLYDSGTLFLPPVIIALLAPILPSTLDEQQFHLYTALLWTAFDVLTGIVLANAYTQKQRYLKRIHSSDAEQAQLDSAILAGSSLSSPGGVAAFYLFNPYTLATCLARSTTVFSNLALVSAVNAALHGSTTLLAVSSAAATLVSLYPVLLVPSLALLCATAAMPASSSLRRRRSQAARTWSRTVFIVSLLLIAAATASGVYLSFVISAYDWQFLQRAYGTIITLPDLSPNIGLWWYFFIEIFDHFRDFFLLAFNVHAASYAVPFAIKYHQDPLFAVTALTGLIATLKSYPTLGDTAVYLSLLSLHREIAPYFRHPLVTALMYTLATLMMPALHYLWLDAGSGNANFFYATTLIWAIASGAAVLDAMWAWGRWRWEAERPRLHVDAAVAVVGGEKKQLATVTRKVVQI